MKIVFFSRLVLISFVAFVCPALADDCDDPQQLHFSLIPQGNAQKDAAAFQSLLKELERETGKKVKTILPSSYGSVVEGLLAQSIDLAMLGPASYAAAKNSGADLQVFASYSARVGVFQEEGPFYRALLIVRGQSKFTRLEALRGTKLALVDPLSTSGSVLPRHLFTPIIGSPFEKFFGSIVYTGGHDKSAIAIQQGRVDAAFVSSFILSEAVDEKYVAKSDFRILWQSEPIPLDPFVYRSQLCAPIKEKIRKVFLSNNGEAFPAVLEMLNAKRFVPISDGSYKIIREILQSSP